MIDFYMAHDVRMLWLPPDCGLGFARNRALEQVSTRYVLLADDDFEFTDHTDLERPLTILEQERRIGFLGGRLVDVRADGDGGERRYLRRWEKVLLEAGSHDTLVSVPIDWLPPRERIVGDARIHLCDMTLNWGLLRRAVFDDRIRWDESIKINGEHEDFFLNLKRNSSWEVAFFPGLVCDHRPRSPRGYGELRQRLDGRRQLSEKWGFTHHLELGLGLRDYEAYTEWEPVPRLDPHLLEVPNEPGLEIAPAPKPIDTVNAGQRPEPGRGPRPSRSERVESIEKNLRAQRALAERRLRDLEACHSSWSWRLTAPLRWFAERFGGGRGEGA